MSIKKRLAALAVAGASAVVLGGAFGLTQHATNVSASAPTIMVIGCAQGSNPAILQWPTSVAAAAPAPSTVTQGQINGPQASVTAVGTVVINQLSLTAPSTQLLCGVAMQDSLQNAGIVPPLPPCALITEPGAVNVNDADCDVNTVDQGNVTYNLLTANGRFAITSTGVNFAAGGAASTVTLACASSAPGVGVGSVAGTTTAQSDQCQGAIPGAGFVTANPALDITVGFASGVPLSSFGNLTGIQGLNGGFSIQAQYTRTPSLSAALATVPAATNVGPNTVTTQSQVIGLIAPVYYEGLSANPTTIAANPTLNNSNPGVASTGNGGGSTITASMYTVTSGTPFVIGAAGGSSVIVAPSGGIVTSGGAILTPGSEPGTVTFVTNSGIFSSPSTTNTSAQQTVAVACGVLPGSNLFFNPATFSFGTFSFSSCTSATATLYGGGAAGTATVVATFVGSITGQQAQNAVNVAFSLASNTQALARGCDEFITPASLAANTPIATLVGTVTPSSAVVSVWQYNNATQSFNALYFSTPGAPVNGNAVGGGQSVFICVSGPATIGNGAF